MCKIRQRPAAPRPGLVRQPPVRPAAGRPARSGESSAGLGRVRRPWRHTKHRAGSFEAPAAEASLQHRLASRRGLALVCRRLGTPRARRGPARTLRRDAGVVERGGLENRCARERTQGSNPCPSAILLRRSALRRIGIRRLREAGCPSKLQRGRAADA